METGLAARGRLLPRNRVTAVESGHDPRTPNSAPIFGDYFDLNVRWRGSRPAFIFGENVLTWAELGRQSYRVANGLTQLGIGRGSVVAILLDNRLETAEIVLGVIRCGATIVPINLAISDDAIVKQIHDSGATALIAVAEEADRVDGATLGFEAGRRVVVGPRREGWTDYSEWRDEQQSKVPPIISEPDDVLTIVYSSGTTGIPKGIVHTQFTRLCNMQSLGVAFRVHEDTVWVSSLGLYSNACMLPLLITLSIGGCVLLLPRFDAGEFLRAIERHRATHSLLVPVMLRAMLGHPDFDRCDVSSMEMICVGGASVEPDYKEMGRDRFGCVLIELYGLTEGFATITSATDSADKRASVGRPLPGMDLKILLDDGAEAKVGQPGEIVGFAPALMTGYLNRPDETEAVFLNDERGRRWFRTGDIGKLDADGFLYYVGRKKDLIISGGQNIFPADIEEVGRAHPDVAQIAVVGVPHSKWDETPVAVIVPRPGVMPDSGELQAWINERVGKRQRVSAVVLATCLPVNALGKVLKRELRAAMLTNPDVLKLGAQAPDSPSAPDTAVGAGN